MKKNPWPAINICKTRKENCLQITKRKLMKDMWNIQLVIQTEIIF